MNKYYPTLVLSLVTISLSFFPSCKSSEEVQVNSSLSVDADAIKNIEVTGDTYAELVSDVIDNVSIELISGTRNRNVQRAAIEMKKFFNKKMKKFENIEDPRKTFLNTWSLIYRFQAYVTTGDGKNLFTDQQDKVKTTLTEILLNYEATAKKHLNEKQFPAIQNDLKKYADTFPIKGYFQDAPEAAANGFISYITIPLAPFKAVGAINQSGQSMEDIAKSVAKFTEITEGLPDEIRWQLQVLAVQLQQNDILKTNTDSFKKLAETSEQLTAIVEKYPDRVSEKVTTAAKDLDKTISKLETISKQIDDSMTRFQTSSENFKHLGDNINSSSEKIASSLKQVEQSSKALTAAAENVSKTVQDIQKFAEYVNKDNENSSPGKTEDSFLVEVEKASTALEKSASQVTTALNKILELGQKKPLNEEILALDASAKKTVIMTREQSETLIDHIFKKALILVFVIFALAMITVITKSRLTKTVK